MTGSDSTTRDFRYVLILRKSEFCGNRNQNSESGGNSILIHFDFRLYTNILRSRYCRSNRRSLHSCFHGNRRPALTCRTTRMQLRGSTRARSSALKLRIHCDVNICGAVHNLYEFVSRPRALFREPCLRTSDGARIATGPTPRRVLEQGCCGQTGAGGRRSTWGVASS